MIARQQRDNLDLLRIEAAQLAVLDQIVRVPVVPLVADVHAGVVEQGAVFEPLALAVAELVDRAGLVEDRQRELRHVARVGRRVAAALAELDDAAPAHVGVPLDLPDRRGVAVDVVEDEPFAQREIAQRDVFRAEPAEHAVEQDRPGDGDVGAARVEPVHVQAGFKIRAAQPLAQPVDGLGRHAPVPQRLVADLAVFAERERAEAEDRARRADDAIESALGDACRDSRRSPC